MTLLHTTGRRCRTHRADFGPASLSGRNVVCLELLLRPDPPCFAKIFTRPCLGLPFRCSMRGSHGGQWNPVQTPIVLPFYALSDAFSLFYRPRKPSPRGLLSPVSTPSGRLAERAEAALVRNLPDERYRDRFLFNFHIVEQYDSTYHPPLIPMVFHFRMLEPITHRTPPVFKLKM